MAQQAQTLPKVVIMKFGGSCLVNAASFQKIVDILNMYKDDHEIICVASALNGVTDRLIKLAESAGKPNLADQIAAEIESRHFDIADQIFAADDAENYYIAVENYVEKRFEEIENTLSEILEFGMKPFYLDSIISNGEKLSTFMLSSYLQYKGIDTQFYTGEELIITDDNFFNALPLFKEIQNRVEKKLKPLIMDPAVTLIFCVTGFIGRNMVGNTTTLGRGGSDFTATILAHAIYDTKAASEIKVIFWKDVDGILATDPKYVKGARLVPKMSYDEAKELAFFGAKILHPKCLAAVEKKGIPVEIRNFDKPQSKVFSLIGPDTDEGTIKGISMLPAVQMISVNSGALVEIPGVLAKIFQTVADAGVSVSMVSQSSSEVNTTFVVGDKDGPKAVKALKEDPFFKLYFDVTSDPVAIVAVVGKAIPNSSIKARIYKALGDAKINSIAVAQSSDGMNISMIVKREQLKDAVAKIYEEFKI